MWGSFSNEGDFTLDLFDKFGSKSMIGYVMNEVAVLFRECGGKLDYTFDCVYLIITDDYIIVKKTRAMFQKMTNDERKLFMTVSNKVLTNSKEELSNDSELCGLKMGIEEMMELLEILDSI